MERYSSLGLTRRFPSRQGTCSVCGEKRTSVKRSYALFSSFRFYFPESWTSTKVLSSCWLESREEEGFSFPLDRSCDPADSLFIFLPSFLSRTIRTHYADETMAQSSCGARSVSTNSWRGFLPEFLQYPFVQKSLKHLEKKKWLLESITSVHSSSPPNQ